MIKRRRFKRGVYAMHNGRLVPVEQIPVAEAKGGTAARVHDDRLYRTAYDPGLGYGYSSRAERRRIIAGINRARQFTGDPQLRERGY